MAVKTCKHTATLSSFSVRQKILNHFSRLSPQILVADPVKPVCRADLTGENGIAGLTCGVAEILSQMAPTSIYDLCARFHLQLLAIWKCDVMRLRLVGLKHLPHDTTCIRFVYRNQGNAPPFTAPYHG